MAAHSSVGRWNEGNYSVLNADSSGLQELAAFLRRGNAGRELVRHHKPS